MRIFVLGAGATGSLLAQLLEKQGHTVQCGDRDPERARRFLGKESTIPVQKVNARNIWAIVRAARGNQLLINASASVLNEIVLRSALRLRTHYLDLSSHMTRNPFRAEQIGYKERFEEKNRTSVINAGAAPGLTNLLVKRGAEMMDSVASVQIRLYESMESRDPVSQWSPQVLFDEAISRPRVYQHGKFKLEKRFGGLEWFPFPPPIGRTRVVLAAQDEVVTLPYFVPMRDLDVKFGGNEIDRLRRWHRQGKLSRSRGIVPHRFPKTPTPRMVAKLIRRGLLHNARFAAAILMRGVKKDYPVEIRWHCAFPTLYQIRQEGLFTTPVAYATAHIAALFVKHFPKDFPGVHPPEALPREVRRAILADVRSHSIRIRVRVRRLKKIEDDEEV
jgi:hypothetical protein